MYKLILADDEAEIRQGLKEVVPFEELGFTVVGEAANGVEALQLCEQLEPDLLITDIRMPLLDGLTLCRRVREALPAAQFIILSGYDDFEYARQAIEVKTMGYLLKPISSAEFSSVLSDAKASLDEEFGKRRDVRRLREYFHESLPLLREMLLSSLLSGDVTTERAMEGAVKYGDDLRAGGYAVALIRLGEDGDASGIADPELRLFAVKNILNEALQERAHEYRFYLFMHNGMLAILFLLDKPDEAAFAHCVCHLDEARKTVWHYLSCPLHIGVSAPCVELGRIPTAARQAHGAMDQSMLSGQAQVLLITDLQPDSGRQLSADDLQLRRLMNSIKAGDDEQAGLALADLMDACRRNRPNPRDWQAYLLEIFMCYMRVISDLALAREALDSRMDRLTQVILKTCPSVDDAQDELGAFLQALLEEADNHRKTSSRLLASEAEQYLQQNYAQADITMERLCLHLHISPSYFSMVFKKETKKTFHQYLTELRMDRALTLLSSTELKTAQIAERVGLPDPSYFSYCFKKHFGYPPSRARGK